MARFEQNYLFFLVVLCCCFNAAHAEKITIAVASNFVPLFADLLPDFKRLYSDSDVILISGSSSKIYAQIKHGAPFDIFMSADQDKPLKLVEEGLAIPESRFTYAIGCLVLWSADSTRINNSSDVLKNVSFNKLALANSKLAPYGLAAEQVLGQLGLLNSFRAKWVQGENIAQTYQFVATRNADLGFVAKSQVWRNNRLMLGSVWEIPAELYSPIKQDAVILKKAKDNEMAIKMMSFLQTPVIRHKIEEYGYLSMEISSEFIGGNNF